MNPNALRQRLCIHTTVIALSLPVLATGLAAQDLAKRQLAAAASNNPEHRAAVLDKVRNYEATRERIQQQIATVNNRTGILAGPIASAAAGWALTRTPLGAAAGGFLLGPLVRIAVTDALNRRLLDDSARLALMDSRAENRSRYDAYVESAPGTEERSILTQQVVDGSPYMDLLQDLEDADEAGPLLEHVASLEEYLLGLDSAAYTDIGELTDREAADWVESEFPDLHLAAVEHGETMTQGRSALLQLAGDWNDIAERISTQGGLEPSLDEGVLPDLGEVAVQPAADRIFAPNGDILDMSGRRTGEHDQTLGEIPDSEVVDLTASYGQMLSDKAFQESLLFASLPTDAKLKALQNPAFMSHLDPTQRQKIEERLALQQDLRELQDVRSITSSVTSILATTSILDSEDAQAANDVANTAVSAAMAFVSCSAREAVTCLQGVSEVVSGLSSLFGGDSGPSASDQLLEGQRRLLEGQRILMEGQRALLEGQLAARQELRAAHQDVLKNRIALLEATDAIDRRMAAGFEDLQRALGVQLWEIGQLVDVMREFSEFGIEVENCQSFLDVRREYDSFEERLAYVPETLDRGFSVGEFSTWRDLQAHFRTYRSRWMACLNTVGNVFSSRQIRRDLHSVFRFSIYRGRTSGGTFLTDYVNPGFAPLIRFLSRHYSAGADRPECVPSVRS